MPTRSLTLTQSPSLELVGALDGTMRTVFVQGEYAYIGVGLQLVVLDVSNPAAPVVQDFATLPAGRLYLVVQQQDGPNNSSLWKLQVIVLSNPAVPVVVGSVRPHLPALHRVLASDDSYLYFMDQRGQLRLADLSNPASPQDIGAVLSFDPSGYVQGIDIAGPELYLGIGHFQTAIILQGTTCDIS